MENITILWYIYAQTNNKEGAEEYMQKLKNAVTENGVIDSKWDKVIEDFQNNINKIKNNDRYVLYEDLLSHNRWRMDDILITK